MNFHQAESRGIRARNQAMIRIGGEQERAVALSYFLAGVTASALSRLANNCRQGDLMMARSTTSPKRQASTTSKTTRKPRKQKTPELCCIDIREQVGEGIERISNLPRVEAESLAAIIASLDDRDCVKVLPNDQPEPSPSAIAKFKIGRMLEDLTGGKIHVYYSPTTFLNKDRGGSQGHLFSGFSNGEETEEFLTLDDRRPEPLDVQLASELHGIAKWYTKIARKIERHIERREYRNEREATEGAAKKGNAK